MKVHGFGTAPATKSFPAMSFPPVISNVYVVSLEKSLCEYVAVVLPALHTTLHPKGSGVHVNVTEDVFISSLKVTTTSVLNITSMEPFAGDVRLISGGITSSVVKVHGFGTAPATKSLPAKSFPPVISKV